MVLNNLKRGLVGASLAAVLGLTAVTGVSANSANQVKTNDVDITITAPEVAFDLQVPTIKGFGTIELKATPQSYTTGFNSDSKAINKNFGVIDLRGTHAGWNLTVQASTFENKSTSHKLPNGSLTLGGQVKGVALGSTPNPGTKSIARTVIDDNAALSVEKFAPGSGMGQFDYKFAGDALEITVDSTTAKAGTYNSTLTWTLYTGPNAN